MDDKGIRLAMAKNGCTVVCQGICRTNREGRALIFETESHELNAALLKKAVESLTGVQDVVVRIIAGAAPPR